MQVSERKKITRDWFSLFILQHHSFVLDIDVGDPTDKGCSKMKPLIACGVDFIFGVNYNMLNNKHIHLKGFNP